MEKYGIVKGSFKLKPARILAYVFDTIVILKVTSLNLLRWYEQK